MEVSTPNPISNGLIWADWMCDHIPVVCIATNLIVIFEKCVLSYCNKGTVRSNHYFSYIKEKPIGRCILLILPLPILTTIILIVVEIAADSIKRDQQDDEAEKLRLIGPAAYLFKTQTTAQREEFLLREQEDYGSWNELKDAIVRVGKLFNEIIENPNVLADFSINGEKHTCEGSHEQRIDCSWSHIKAMLPTKADREKNLSGLTSPRVSKTLSSIFSLEAQLIEMRKTSLQMRNYDDEESLLTEAKHYYVQSFPEDQRTTVKAELAHLEPEALRAKLEERVQSIKEKREIVEIEFFISQIKALIHLS